uniref:Cofactor assembly of complex C subunit B n=1 Tax=Paulinella micropora TaxID=1928728 RepID=A0A385I0T8_9EUKA|nr:hypothetical protein PMNZ_608 [Paulinella micropora]AXY63541.1 hypothetical protein PMNZ_608 [Paulinella micropora]
MLGHRDNIISYTKVDGCLNLILFSTISSTFLLTLLLAIGLIFFLRAASKDRTTVVRVRSSRPAIEVLNGLVKWLNQRGWEQEDGDIEKKILRFRGSVVASTGLAILLSALGTIGAGCLGLIIVQLFPSIGWWPLLSVLLGPIAGRFYQIRAARPERVEFQLVSDDVNTGALLQLRAHRDELIALELELGPSLGLVSDGDLLSSPL